MKKVVLVRGLPGSGKSTAVKAYIKQLTKEFVKQMKVQPQVAIHSTDSYFLINGAYHFDKTRLPEFHELNQQAFCHSLKLHIPIVVCDNTNIEEWQRRPYIEAAEKYGYDIEIMNVGLMQSARLHTIYEQRNEHHVSVEVIQSMAQRAG